MTPLQKQEWIEAKVADILERLSRTDVVTENTCDYPNWDKVAHVLMPDVANKLRNRGVNVGVSVNWGVTDYVFV